MGMRPTKPFRMAPLQRLAVKPIEDPAEQAALDERLKGSNDADGGGDGPAIENRRTTGDVENSVSGTELLDKK